VAELPVLEVLSAVHILADLTLGLGPVAHDCPEGAAAAASRLRISQEEVVRTDMLEGTVGGKFTTAEDVADTVLSAPPSAPRRLRSCAGPATRSPPPRPARA